ncbi:Mut7-C RNAse domain-containing protein [Pedosphaera parvula]|uniref:Mut7-C RNAse domain-containing protein n=1 Tax=Pedosphaera parvula (strain Ellin514) TaxID=320771 RepID=B9XQY1_PEDPL|nr:Mut7-C RNAse domain-containing protein [Pedosphaera parvula]EEF57758.1 protein of unknown function DUF82 [Pedosphaera parvula Ellin514]
MSRIGKAYETKFRAILVQLRARKADQGVRWLMDRARYLSREKAITPAQALAEVYGHALHSLRIFVRHDQSRDSMLHGQPAIPRFLCDAGLGGLARWLRASGYEAVWIQDINDDDLLIEGQRLKATILTTDSMLMERRVLRDRIIPAVWVPPTLTMLEQLALIFQELDLQMRGSRCMACGGELLEVDKESVSDRIPPRTLKWLDQFYQCSQCGKLFWHGTHWRKIIQRLEAV